jgi:uncharacterized membrane protein YfcA
MNLPFLALSLVCAGFVQGLTGFGFGLVSMSLMPLVISVKQAAAISTVFSLLATITTFLRHCRDYNWRLGLAFLVSVCVGVPVGVYFLDRASEGLILRVLGVLMLLFAAREFLLARQPQAIPPALTVPMGLFSGALSGAFNLGGIPSAAYAYAHPWSRGQIMAFLQVMITLSCALRIVFYSEFGYFKEISLGQAVLLVVPLYAAIWLGHAALRRIQPQYIRKGVFAFIGLAGIYYLFLHQTNWR